MSRSAMTLGLLSLLFGLTSCEPLQNLLGKGESAENGNASGIDRAFAVIDLNTVAQRLGRDDAFRQTLQVRQNQLSGELNQLRGKFLQDARTFQSELGEAPSPEDQQKLATLINQMNARLNQAQQTASQQLTQTQVAQVQKFYAEVRPIALTVARERGYNAILNRSDDIVFAYDPRSDITEEVVRRLGTPVVP